MKLAQIAGLLLCACSAFAQAPSVTSDPVNSTQCPGGSATFAVTAAGAEPLSYQWYFGVNPLSNATNSSLTVSNLASANAGNYSVVITNAEGAVTSAVAQLVVNQATTVVGPTNLANRCLGESVVFTATASGTGPFTYLWRKDGAELAGETGNTLSLTVAPTTAGTYSVEVAGACNSVTNSATLSVAAAPAITVQPQSQSTPMGNGATFSVTAPSTGPANTYQWQTNGVDVAGANGSSFSISNVTFAHDGLQVGVTVANCNGSIASTAATLSVTPISGISFDFNTPGQYTNQPYYLTYNNWLNTSLTTPLPLFESAVGGVGAFPGSGSLDLPGNNAADNTSLLLPVSYDFSAPGKEIYAATMFKMKTPLVAQRRATQIGFVTSTNIGLADTSPQGFMSVIIQNFTNVDTRVELRTQRRNTGGGLQESIVTSQVPLTVSNWYKLTAKFVNTKAGANNTFTIESALQDMGPLGTTPGDVVLSFTTTTNNADIVNFRNVFFALRSFEDGGVEARDNTYIYTTPGPVFFVQQPKALTVQQGRRGVFQALVDGEGPYTYQWFKNGSAIAGAKSWNYIVPSASLADNGATYHVEVTGPANTVASDPATLTVTPDALAVLSVGSVDGALVGVRFNQPVDVASAENPANYSINGTPAVAARVYRTSLGPLGPEGVYVLLTPASLVSGTFNVTVSGVQDLSGNAIAGGTANGQVENLTGVDVNPLLTAPAGEHYSFGSGQFIITGGGNDIWSTADAFHFVYATRTGDFDLIAQIPYIDLVRAPTKVGFDARASLDPFSVRASMFANPIVVGRQYAEGSYRQLPNTAAASYGNTPRLNFPDAWVRFRRAGNTFMRYTSTNGINWQFDGQISPNPALPDTLYVGLGVCSVANNVAASGQFENVGAFAGYTGAEITIASNPTNITVNSGSAANIGGLVATVTGGGIPSTAGELTYLWQRSDGNGGWTNMPTAGATNNILSVGTVWGSDNGAQYRAIISAPGAAPVTSGVATLTVNDSTVPTISAVNGLYPSYPADSVVITFSEPIDPTTALDINNYTVTGPDGNPRNVISASFLGLGSDPRTIVLRLSAPLGTGNASVVVNGVRDLNNNVLATVTRTFRSFATPVAPVVMEVYQEIGTETAVSGLTGHATFTGGQPTWIVYSNMMAFNAGLGALQDRYGVKAYTYFVPPTTGTYKFWMKNDDGAQLWMNTNAVNSTDPAGKVLILENAASVGNNYTLNASAKTNLALVAGQRYYMEVLYKENSGNDGFAVNYTAVNAAAPANTTFIPYTALEYPAEVAPRTPVIAEFYTGYVAPAAGNGNGANLTAATSIPTSIPPYNQDGPNYKFLAGIPDVVGYEKTFGLQPQLGHTRFDNHVGRIYSYFIPPTNGNYKFYMRSDDASQLFMNTNAVNSTDPLGAVLMGRLDAYTAAYTLVAQNVQLVGGQKYFIEARFKDGTGGDGVAVAVRGQTETSVPSITSPVETIPASMLEYPTPLCRAGEVGIAGMYPGENVTVKEGERLVLSPIRVSGGAPYGFNWFKNGQRILDNSFTNITQPFTLSDNGAVYTLVVTNFFSSASRSVTVTVTPDTTAPTIVRATGFRYADGFSLEFSEPVDPVTATYLGNYQVSGGLTLISASINPLNSRVVSFRTATQAPGTTYTVTVNGVKDISQAGNTIASGSTAQFSTWSVGGNGLLVEIWTNITGGAIQDLTGQPRYQANTPDVHYYTNVFGIGAFGANTGLEVYGARISGYFVPTNSGYYRFYLRSDDASQFWMNINSTDSENPAGRTMLIHVQNANISMADPRAQSQPVLLNQGQRYYVEGLLKEGTGGDYLAMAFRSTDENGTAPEGTPGDVVGSLATSASFGGAPGNPDVVQVTSVPPSDLTVEELATATIALDAMVPSYVRLAGAFQWQKSDGFGGFTNLSFTGQGISFIARLEDDGAQYRLMASFPGFSNSWTTTLHVTPNSTPPYIVSAGSIDGKTLTVVWNEPMDPLSSTESLYYDIDGNIFETEGSGALQEDQRTIVFTLKPDSYLTTSPFTLGGGGIGNAAENIAYNSYDQVQGVIEFLDPVVIGIPTVGIGGYNPLGTNFAFAVTNGGINMSANGWDIWNAADGYMSAHRLVSGDFDIHVRVQSLIGSDQWSKAGLMVRPALTNNSRHMFFGVTPTSTPVAGQVPVNNHTFQWRDTDNANAAPFLGSFNSLTNPPTYPNSWIRLERVGSVINAYLGENGTDWTLYMSRDTAAQSGGAYPEAVYLGLAAVSHDQTRALANNAYVEYRNLHFPLAPQITTQPTPSATELAVGGSFSLTGLAATGEGTLTYQWRRNGVALPGQNGSTLAINNAQAADSGIYTVLVGNDGGGTVSDPISIVVNDTLPVAGMDTIVIDQGQVTNINLATLLANDTDAEGATLSVLAVSGVLPVTFSADFNDGLLPTNTAIYGVAGGGYISTNGGVADSGMLRLTDAVNSQSGALVLRELAPRKRVAAFTASFKLRIGNASAQPADGFAFAFGAIPDASSGGAENGVGGGNLAFTVDNYQFAPFAGPGSAAGAPGGGTANTAGMKIIWNNVNLAGVQIPVWNAAEFIPVTVTMTEEGVVTVTVNGTNVFGSVTLPGYAPRAGRFGFYARTGGQNQTHWVDDVSITQFTLDTSRDYIVANAALYGSAYISGEIGVPNSGAVHLTDNVNSQVGGFVINELTPGTAVQSLNASFKLRIGNGTGNAADGMSFNFAADLPDGLPATAAEEGVGTGLAICIDNYPTGGPGAPAIKVKFGGIEQGAVLIPKWNLAAFVPVNVTVDSDGTVDVVVNGTNVFSNLQLTNYVPVAGRFGFFGRTGGENETHWVDDISLNVTTANGPATYTSDFNSGGPGQVTYSGGIVTYNPGDNACGTDTFYYLLSDGQAGGVTWGAVNVTINPTNGVMPAIGSCVPARTVTSDGNGEYVLPDLRGELIASGNCLTIIQSPAPGTVLGLGATTVSFTVTDVNNNEDSCTTTVTVLSDAVPGLLVVRSGANVEISWPQTPSTYVLEENTEVTANGGWTTSTATVQLVNGRHTAVIPADVAAKFFRLRKQ